MAAGLNCFPERYRGLQCFCQLDQGMSWRQTTNSRRTRVRNAPMAAVLGATRIGPTGPGRLASRAGISGGMMIGRGVLMRVTGRADPTRVSGGISGGMMIGRGVLMRVTGRADPIRVSGGISGGMMTGRAMLFMSNGAPSVRRNVPPSPLSTPRSRHRCWTSRHVLT